MRKIYLAGLLVSLSSVVNAGLITHSDYTSAGVITASGQNANENAIFNEFDGNIESINIKDATIAVADLSSAITAKFITTGLFTWWAGTKLTVPTGWLYCDGSAISRTTYADLFAIIGTKYGQGDNSTTFNLPDTRGYFVRGQDDGAGRDPDAASRTAAATGGATGDSVGSVQLSTYTAHTHPVTITDPGHVHQETITNTAGGTPNSFTNANSNGAGTAAAVNTQSNTTGITAATSAGSGGAETRPRNLYMVGIIKS